MKIFVDKLPATPEEYPYSTFCKGHDADTGEVISWWSCNKNHIVCDNTMKCPVFTDRYILKMDLKKFYPTEEKIRKVAEKQLDECGFLNDETRLILKSVNESAFTVDKLIKYLEQIKKETDADGNTKILFGTNSMGNSPTVLYYNDGSDRAIWHGKYVVIE